MHAVMHNQGAESGEVNQYLTFQLGTEQYGVNILQVREIRGFSPVTQIPHSPRHMLGVLNLRGLIVPVIDLRMRFGLEVQDYTPTTVVIVLNLQSEQGQQDVGVVVDAVSDVVNVSPEQTKPRPAFGSREGGEFVSALAALEDRMVLLLDIDKILAQDELEQLAELRMPEAGMHADA